MGSDAAWGRYGWGGWGWGEGGGGVGGKGRRRKVKKNDSVSHQFHFELPTEKINNTVANNIRCAGDQTVLNELKRNLKPQKLHSFIRTVALIA